MTIRKRLERLEGVTGTGHGPSVITLDDMLGDDAASSWPETVAGVRLLDDKIWSDADESVADFRGRLSRRVGMVPAGALPLAVADLILR